MCSIQKWLYKASVRNVGISLSRKTAQCNKVINSFQKSLIPSFSDCLSISWISICIHQTFIKVVIKGREEETQMWRTQQLSHFKKYYSKENTSLGSALTSTQNKWGSGVVVKLEITQYSRENRDCGTPFSWGIQSIIYIAHRIEWMWMRAWLQCTSHVDSCLINEQ